MPCSISLLHFHGLTFQVRSHLLLLYLFIFSAVFLVALLLPRHAEVPFLFLQPRLVRLPILAPAHAHVVWGEPGGEAVLGNVCGSDSSRRPGRMNCSTNAAALAVLI